MRHNSHPRVGHFLYETTPSVRCTISEPAHPAKILARLLKLNHERYAEEVKQGLHDKKKSGGAGRVKGGGKKIKADQQDTLSLFDDHEE